MLISKLEREINAIWKTKDSLSSKSNKKIINTIDKTIGLIDEGKIRVAEKTKNKWKVNEWIKKAILLSFRVNEQKVISNGPANSSWWDKVPSKFSNWKKKDFKKANFRVVPNAVVRKGTHIQENVVLMPSFVNLSQFACISGKCLPGGIHGSAVPNFIKNLPVLGLITGLPASCFITG